MQGLVERLDALYRGATFEGLQLLQFNALKTVAPSPDDLVGRTVIGAERRAKYAIVDLDGPRLVFHLSQGGRVDIEDPPKTTRPKPGVARLHFSDRGHDDDHLDSGGERPSMLIKEFGTERRAGVWLLEATDPGPLVGLGPEPDSDEFADLLLTVDDNRRIHTVLRDQRTVAGIGRGHADDALHRAGISPFASLAKLDDTQRHHLVASVRGVLAEALEHERHRTGGLPTKLGDRFIVHRRHGQQCPAAGCDDTLRRVSFESHEIVYCPSCQTGGKVLADRRLSRLLK